MNARLVLGVAALSGFVALSYEIVWYRVFTCITEGASATFGLLLSVYLAGIAVGALAGRALCREGSGAGEPRSLRGLAAFTFVAHGVAFPAIPAIAWLVTVAPWGWTLCIVGFVATLLGATLPLLSHFAVAPDSSAGARFSHIYVGNIVGSTLGSLVTGFVLMDVWSMRGISVFLLVLGLLTVLCLVQGAGLAARVRALVALGLVGAAVVAGLGAPRLFDRVYERLLTKRRDEIHGRPRFVHLVENRNGVIGVTENHYVFGDGAYNGRISTDIMQVDTSIFRAYAAAHLHPRPREVLLVGLSGGGWAAILAHHPRVEKLTAVEINPGFLEIISRYPQVAGILDHPKVEIVVDDARRWLARNPDRRFDLIVQNTPQHWRAHMTNLLSREYLDLVRSHLRPDGVYYGNATGSAAALRTGALLFPHALRVGSFLALSGAPIHFEREGWRKLLLEYRIFGQPCFDLSDRAQRARFEEVASLADAYSTDDKAVVLETRDSILSRTAGVPLVTDDNMATEWTYPFGKDW